MPVVWLHEFIPAPPQVIQQLVLLSTSPLLSGTQNAPYSLPLQATGGLGPYQWSIVSGSLDPGLLLDAVTGIISGTPVTNLTYTVTIQVKDGVGNSATRVFSLTINSASGAFDFYVGPSGADTNPGTQAQPWAFSSFLNTSAPNHTVQGGANNAQMAGKRIGILPGTYSLQTIAGGQWAGGGSQVDFLIPAGTAGNSTVVQSTSPRAAILDCQGFNHGFGNWSSTSQYIVIDGFEVRNLTEGFVQLGYTGLPSGSLPGFICQNCWGHGQRSTTNNGNPCLFYIHDAANPLVNNCKYTDYSNSNGRSCALVIFWNSTQPTLLNSTVQAAAGNTNCGCAYVKNQSQKDAFIAYNYFDVSAATSIAPDQMFAWDLGGAAGDTSTFHHNILVIGNAGTGMYYANAPGVGPQPYSVLENKLIYNNTFVGGSLNTNSVVQFGMPATLTFYNNIIAHPAGSAGFRGDVDFSASSPALTDFNCFPPSPVLGLSADGGTAYPTAPVPNTIAKWQAVLPAGCVGKDANSVLGSPVFVGGTPAFPAQFYQLQAGSPGKGTGSVSGLFGGAPCDMGAWGGASPPAQIGCNF